MGAGIQNILGAYMFEMSKPKGFGHLLRAIGLTLYVVGWFDLRFEKASPMNPIASDFAEDTIIKMILFLLLNYYLIRHVIRKGFTDINGNTVYQEFLIQAGYKKRIQTVSKPSQKAIKGRLQSFGDEFLYQSGMKKRPY
jgi:hypothetical protein